VLDYNGTIARDGRLIPGVKDLLAELSESLAIHIVTADTFGSAQRELKVIPCKITVIGKEDHARAKADYVRKLEAKQTVCTGNGRNDALIFKEAGLGGEVTQIHELSEMLNRISTVRY